MTRPHKKQQGIALLMFVFVMALIAITVVIKYLDTNQIENLRNQRTASVLADAKAALIGWSVGHPNFPGTLPFPDRSLDLNYDGNSDCVVGVPALGLLIGQLPQAAPTAPCVGAANFGLSIHLDDGHSERLWYAVSRNLVRTVAAGGVGAARVNPAMPDANPAEWLVVRDKNGQVISNRVAAVIIAPGYPVGAQDRSGGLAGPAAYLDTITIAGTTYSNNNYAAGNVAFIMGEDMQHVSTTHPTYQQPYQFNDKLVFITIDELMLALERRVVREAANALRTYYIASNPAPANRFYPYAATLGDNSNVCVEGLQTGYLPTEDTGTDCTHPNANLTPLLPGWFTENDWQHHFYYVISNDCNFAVPGCVVGNITVGVQNNVDALLISAGSLLAGQARLSGNLNDYMDSGENTDGDLIFDAVGTPITPNYNDQMLIVAP